MGEWEVPEQKQHSGRKDHVCDFLVSWAVGLLGAACLDRQLHNMVGDCVFDAMIVSTLPPRPPPHGCVISPMLYSIHTQNWIGTHLQIYHQWSWLWSLGGSSSPMTLSPSTTLQWEVPILTDPVQQCLAKHCTGLFLPTPGGARPEPPGLLEVQFTTATAKYSCSAKQFIGMMAKTERVRRLFPTDHLNFKPGISVTMLDATRMLSADESLTLYVITWPSHMDLLGSSQLA